MEQYHMHYFFNFYFKGQIPFKFRDKATLECCYSYLVSFKNFYNGTYLGCCEAYIKISKLQCDESPLNKSAVLF